MAVTMNMSASTLMDTVLNNSNTYKYAKERKVVSVDADVRNVENDAKKLRSSIRNLKGYNSGVSDERLIKRMKTFISKYNDFTENNSKVDNEEYQEQLTELKSLVTSNTKYLKRVGIVFNDEGELEFDKNKFDLARSSQLEYVFSGRNSFMSQADKVVKKMYSALEKNETVTNLKTRNLSVTLSDYQVVMGGYASFLTSEIIGLKNLVNNFDADTVDALLTDYSLDYNELINKAQIDEEENIDALKKLHEQNKERLNKIGITYDAMGLLQYTRVTWDSDADAFETLKDLFGESADFGRSVNSVCGKIFISQMQLQGKNIKIDEYV